GHALTWADGIRRSRRHYRRFSSNRTTDCQLDCGFTLTSRCRRVRRNRARRQGLLDSILDSGAECFVGRSHFSALVTVPFLVTETTFAGLPLCSWPLPGKCSLDSHPTSSPGREVDAFAGNSANG